MNEISQAEVRARFIDSISEYSEQNWCAGWMTGIEKEIRTKGGAWILLAFLSGGWPSGYEAEDGWDPLTEEELTIVRESYAVGLFENLKESNE